MMHHDIIDSDVHDRQEAAADTFAASRPAPTFEEVKARYHAAVNEFVPALIAEALGVVKRIMPGALKVRMLGEYNDEGAAVGRIQEIEGPDWFETIEDPSEEFDAACGEADPLFDWLIDLTGDDYMRTCVFTIATGDVEWLSS